MISVLREKPNSEAAKLQFTTSHYVVEADDSSWSASHDYSKYQVNADQLNLVNSATRVVSKAQGEQGGY